MELTNQTFALNIGPFNIQAPTRPHDVADILSTVILRTVASTVRISQMGCRPGISYSSWREGLPSRRAGPLGNYISFLKYGR